MNKPLSNFINSTDFNTELMLNINLKSSSGKDLLNKIICSDLDSISIFLPLQEAMQYFSSLNADTITAHEEIHMDDEKQKNSAKDDSIKVVEVNNNCRKNLLTDREHEIFKQITKGFSNKQIARKLDICEGTVKVHVKNLLRKLNASNRTEAAMKGLDFLEQKRK